MPLCYKLGQIGCRLTALDPEAFLAAAVWGSQWDGHICIWGPRILDDITDD